MTVFTLCPYATIHSNPHTHTHRSSKMPWFSKSKKRKTRARAAVVNKSKDDTLVTSTRPTYAVVVQNFESQTSDGLSVERGQLVVLVSSRDNWIYARNVDGRCGYIPSHFCFPLDQLKVGPTYEKDSRTGELKMYTRPATIYVDTLERPREQQEAAHAVMEDGEEVNSPDSGISCSQPASSSNMASVDSSREGPGRLCVRNNPPTSRAHIKAGTTASKRHFNLHPLPLLETATSSQHSRQGRFESLHSSSPSPPPLPPVNLVELRRNKEKSGASPALQQSGANANTNTNPEREEGEGDGNGVAVDSDDVFLPEPGKPVGIYQSSQAYTAKFQGEMSLQKDEVVVVMEVGRGEWAWAVGCENKEGLVPKTLLHKYRPDTVEDTEEAEPREEEEGSSAGGNNSTSGATETGRTAVVDSTTHTTTTSATQTELVLTGSVHEISCSRRQTPRPSRSSSEHSRVVAETASVAIQTEFTSPDWFKSNSPVATPSPTPHHTLTKCTTSTTATATSTHSPYHHLCTTSSHASSTTTVHTSTSPACTATTSTLNNTPLPHSLKPSCRSSLTPVTARTPSGQFLPLVPATTPQKPSICVRSPSGTGTRTILHNTPDTGNSVPSQPGLHQQEQESATIQRQRMANLAERTTRLRHKQALRQHVRIVNSMRFLPDSDTSAAPSIARCRLQPTTIVTVTKDYAPPSQVKNGLPVSRGDILYAQPHVPFPHGWLWVYHTTLNRSGYVPKQHIAHLYLIQRRPNISNPALLEDEV